MSRFVGNENQNTPQKIKGKVIRFYPTTKTAFIAINLGKRQLEVMTFNPDIIAELKLGMEIDVLGYTIRKMEDKNKVWKQVIIINYIEILEEEKEEEQDDDFGDYEIFSNEIFS